MDLLSSLTGVILAGGLGTRLRSEVADLPKVLAEVCGRPFVTYIFDLLIDAGIQRVVLATGYLGEKVEEQLGKSYGPLSLFYSRESHPLGTGGGLRYASPYFCSDSILVLNGDSFCAGDYAALLKQHLETNAQATMLLSEVPDVSPYGGVEFNGEGCITRFYEKETSRKGGWVSAGVYVLSRKLIESLPTEKVISLESQVFPSLVGKGLCGLRGEMPFFDIGTPESYAAVKKLFFSELPVGKAT